MKPRSGFRLATGLALLIALLGPTPGRAQMGTPVKDLAPGRFLVATRELGDPNFIRTVILLATYDKDGAMGLVLNRPLKLPVSRLFRDLEEAKKRDDPVYEGGPVLPTGILALIRSPEEVGEGGSHVFQDVYLVNDLELLEKQVKEEVGPGGLKVFAGYAGWGSGQLDNEVRLGSWYIFRGDAASVFDPETKTIWKRFIERTELRIALWLSPR